MNNGPHESPRCASCGRPKARDGCAHCALVAAQVTRNIKSRLLPESVKRANRRKGGKP